MIVFAPAKINIGLYITGKRPDGFHELESLFYPAGPEDVLEGHAAKDFSLQVSGANLNLHENDNLVSRAWRLLSEAEGAPPVKMHLLKNIPAGAGLGGGSSDAVAALKLVRALYSLSISDAQLENYAATLGSDCPYFVRGGAQWVGGRGEVLAPAAVDLSEYFITVVSPGIHISTQEAFRHIVPQAAPAGWREALMRPPEEWGQILRNDFQSGIFKRHPLLEHVYNVLCNSGAAYVQMSGTGSSIFAVSRRVPQGIEEKLAGMHTYISEPALK